MLYRNYDERDKIGFLVQKTHRIDTANGSPLGCHFYEAGKDRMIGTFPKVNIRLSHFFMRRAIVGYNSIKNTCSLSLSHVLILSLCDRHVFVAFVLETATIPG